MKVLNLNLHFYPQSIGGATVVAEKLAWGLTQAGHQVTSVHLSLRPGVRDFDVTETPFGRSIGLKNLPQTPGNRYYHPAATSILREIVEAVAPDRIFVHAVQHMGVLDLLSDPALRSRTVVVAHDFYWSCLQGFRTLPDGRACDLVPGPAACRQCAWHPGLTGNVYRDTRDVLAGVRAVVFPSHYLHRRHAELLGDVPDSFVVQSNPDQAETILPDSAALPAPAGRDARARGKTVFGFVGGPGEAKGWGLVRDIMARAGDSADAADGPHVVLFDIGRDAGTPWYPGRARPGVTVASPFHWSFAGHALGGLDVMLMPSRVSESFGLAAREALSLGKAAVIRPSGALAELAGYRGVVMADDADDADRVLAQVAAPDAAAPAWPATTTRTYADRLIAL